MYPNAMRCNAAPTHQRTKVVSFVGEGGRGCVDAVAWGVALAIWSWVTERGGQFRGDVVEMWRRVVTRSSAECRQIE